MARLLSRVTQKQGDWSGTAVKQQTTKENRVMKANASNAGAADQQMPKRHLAYCRMPAALERLIGAVGEVGNSVRPEKGR